MFSIPIHCTIFLQTFVLSWNNGLQPAIPRSIFRAIRKRGSASAAKDLGDVEKAKSQMRSLH